ncbi:MULTISPECIES: hypothetical protein [Marinomonas]|uniref:Uncharacterized protein n=1 Tax=Marinomonas arctica TaxID=383750 RepID=A0A7H1J886_9GAMM|nr:MULTISPECIES: hypothetical protein [Marinomonas]MCS7486652.1 hypothetical protein [Marinomonas sp. BSi20414]QNT06702.1 hypothetical protein IBG28_03360 [Marinomonas arctica]GGN22880.1 hypothetical protein GCM10011350_10870 [Marinomonas arctica]
MENEMGRDKPEKKYNGVSHIPFSHASPSIKQREEQAFYEANSADSSFVFHKILGSIKVIWKTLKRKIFH